MKPSDPRTDERQVLIIAGPNGSGKTTLAQELLEISRLEMFLNLDYIAQELGVSDTDPLSLKTGRLYVRRRERLIKEGRSFGIETTLCGRHMERFVERVRGYGYTVRIVYCFVDSSAVCVERIRIRKELGGHSVPADTVRRRFPVSMASFWNTYRPLVDDWALYYNGHQLPVRVAAGDASQHVVVNQELFDTFRRQIV